MKRTFRNVSVVFLAATLVLLLVGVAWCQFGLVRAERFAKFGLWAETRRSLGLYMLVHPGDVHARLMYADSLINDSELPDEQAIEEAIEQLRKIPDDAPLGASARIKEGRLYYLQSKPARAERAFRKAVLIDPDSLEGHISLKKLLDLTGRSHMAEQISWRAYELSPPDQKLTRLREWFMSQFFPATANLDFDELMGIINPNQPYSERTEAFRFIQFRNSEPDSPIGYVCLARWFQTEGDPEFALEKVLEPGRARMKDEESDPFYLFTAISLLIDMGETAKASDLFDGWPEDQRAGYEYEITRARVLHEARGEYGEAIKSYERALTVWPATFDWLSYNRKAECYLLMQDFAGSAAARKQADEIRGWVESGELRLMREHLDHLDDPTSVLEISEYYKRIGRPREAKCWAEQAAQIITSRAKQPEAAETREPAAR